MRMLPKAKPDNMVLQNLDKELLVYDLESNKAYSLNETSAIVFNACNGQTTFDELKTRHKFTDDLIYLALDELKKESLLADGSYRSPFAEMTRREAARKVGLATMLALPMIASIVAPSALMAQSGGNLGLLAACASDLQCQSNNCTPLFIISGAPPAACCSPTTQNSPTYWPGAGFGSGGLQFCLDNEATNCCSGVSSPVPLTTPGVYSCRCS
jgi:hypothetical protein